MYYCSVDRTEIVDPTDIEVLHQVLSGVGTYQVLSRLLHWAALKRFIVHVRQWQSAPRFSDRFSARLRIAVIVFFRHLLLFVTARPRDTRISLLLWTRNAHGTF